MPSYLLTRSKNGIHGKRLILRDQTILTDVNVQNTATCPFIITSTVSFNSQQLRRQLFTCRDVAAELLTATRKSRRQKQWPHVLL